MIKTASLFFAALLLLVGTASRAQNFWEPANGPLFGAPTELAIEKDGAIVVYMNTDAYDGFFYISRDDGKTWFGDTNQFFVFNGDNPPILESPNGDLFFSNNRSSDEGITWAFDSLIPVAFDSLGDYLRPSYGYTTNWFGKQLYAFDSIGISISTDEGISWNYTQLFSEVTTYNQIPGGYEGPSAIPVGDTGNCVIIGLTNGLIFKSCDLREWDSLPTLQNGFYLLGASPTGTLFAGGDSGLYRLDNRKWTKLDYSSIYSTIRSITFGEDGTVFVETPYANNIHPSLYSSTDNGNSWISLDSSLNQQFVNCYATSPTAAKRIYAGTLALEESTDNGVTWGYISHGLGGGVNCLNISPNGTIMVASSGFYYSTNLGGAWNPIPFPDDLGQPFLWGWDPVSEGPWIYAPPGFMPSLGLVRSSNWGSTWEKYDSGLPLWVDSSRLLGPFLDNCGDQLFSVESSPYSHLFVSSDSGNSWHESLSGVPQYVLTTFISDKFCNIFAGGSNGIFRSTDHGENWEPIKSNLIDTTILALAIDSNGHIFAVTDSFKIFRSNDGGSSWKYLNRITTLPYQSNPAFIISDSRNNLYLTAPTDTAVYISSDEGQSWDKINSGITDASVVSLALSPDGYLIIGTAHNGVFRSVNTTLDAVQPGLLLPLSNLSHNSPNPFNSSTSISFALAEPAFVTLTLFDCAGREIETLANGYMNAGSHSVEFERGNLPAGVYFYRLSANGSSQTAAMVIE